MVNLPTGIAVDLAHALRTGVASPPLEGAEYRGHRMEPGTWVLLYLLPDGRLEEQTIPRWQSDENRARERRAAFRLVTTSRSTSRPES